MNTEVRDILAEEQFIRHRLYGGSGSAWKRYAGLVLARPSIGRLIRYELLTTFLGSIPGTLGMVLRRVFYRFLFPNIGYGVVFGARVTIRHPEQIHLGAGVVVDDDALLDGRGAGEEGLFIGDRVIINRGAIIQAKVGGISIGAETNIGSGAKIISQGPIRIAENVSIAGGCTIAGGQYVIGRDGEADAVKQRYTRGEIRIGPNARLGMNAMVQDGVSIGEGAIVGPASVVMSDVDAHSVVSGFPARPWRKRKVRDTFAQPSPVQPSPASVEPSPLPPQDVLTAQVCAYLRQTRFAEFGADGLSMADSLFDNGILDSLGLVALVAWLEQAFEIDVTEADLVPENFDSVDRIVAFVGRNPLAVSAA